MSYNSIRVTRERKGFKVCATDPAIEKKNRERSKGDGCCSPWEDPNVEYIFDTKEQTVAFIEKAMDIALPADEYTSEFDKLAKEAQKT